MCQLQKYHSWVLILVGSSTFKLPIYLFDYAHRKFVSTWSKFRFFLSFLHAYDLSLGRIICYAVGGGKDLYQK